MTFPHPCSLFLSRVFINTNSLFFCSQLCGICLNNPKDLAFGCGHQVIFCPSSSNVWLKFEFFTLTNVHVDGRWQTCGECGQDLQICPFCRSSIHTRLKLYWSDPNLQPSHTSQNNRESLWYGTGIMPRCRTISLPYRCENVGQQFCSFLLLLKDSFIKVWWFEVFWSF